MKRTLHIVLSKPIQSRRMVSKAGNPYYNTYQRVSDNKPNPRASTRLMRYTVKRLRDTNYTFQEIGSLYQLSRQRIQQIYAKANNEPTNNRQGTHHPPY